MHPHTQPSTQFGGFEPSFIISAPECHLAAPQLSATKLPVRLQPSGSWLCGRPSAPGTNRAARGGRALPKVRCGKGGGSSDEEGALGLEALQRGTAFTVSRGSFGRPDIL